MRQKKTAKRTNANKTTAKSQTNKRNTLILAENVEKEFRSIPSKLASLYRQEIATIKQTENKLKADIKKHQATQKTYQQKHSTLTNAKNKNTPAIKKQIANVKKTIDTATKAIKGFNQQLSQISKTCQALLTKQIKFTELGKQLSTLEKQVEKKAISLAKPKISKPTTARKKPTNKNTVKKQTSEIPQMTNKEITESEFTTTADDSVEIG